MARPREVTDEAILEAARRVFLEHGPAVATSVIAKELGVSAPTLFHRFGNKRALMIAALRPKRGPVLLDGGYDAARSVEAQLLDVAQRFVAFFLSMSREMATLAAAGISPSDIFGSYEGEPPPVQTLRRLSEWFVQAQEAGAVQPGDAFAMAMAFMGGVQAPNFLRMTCGQHAPEQCAPQHYLPIFVRIFARGVTVEAA
jgi:AcrR family transcriptional regulator